MLNQLGGPEPLHTLLNKLDVKLSLQAAEYGLGLTIGNAEVSLLSLTNAYATIARLGEHFPPSLIHQSETNSIYPLTPEACFLITDILSDNQARARARSLGHHIAAKLQDDAPSRLRVDLNVEVHLGGGIAQAPVPEERLPAHRFLGPFMTSPGKSES